MLCVYSLVKKGKITQLFTPCSHVWNEIGRTEIIMDNLDPKFIKNFQVEYRFEERQRFRIKVFDVYDFSKSAPLSKHDFIGEIDFMLHEVVTTSNQTLKRQIENTQFKDRNNGTIIITADEGGTSKNNEMVEMELSAVFKDHAGYNFFIVSRSMHPSDNYVPVYKSEIVQFGEKE